MKKGLELDVATRYVEFELSSYDGPQTTLESQQVEPQPDHQILHTMSLHHLNQWFIDQHDRDMHQMGTEPEVQEPHTAEEVLSTPEKAHWLQAMEKFLEENEVWGVGTITQRSRACW